MLLNSWSTSVDNSASRQRSMPARQKVWGLNPVRWSMLYSFVAEVTLGHLADGAGSRWCYFQTSLSETLHSSVVNDWPLPALGRFCPHEVTGNWKLEILRVSFSFMRHNSFGSQQPVGNIHATATQCFPSLCYLVWQAGTEVPAVTSSLVGQCSRKHTALCPQNYHP